MHSVFVHLIFAVFSICMLHVCVKFVENRFYLLLKAEIHVCRSTDLLRFPFPKHIHFNLFAGTKKSTIFCPTSHIFLTQERKVTTLIALYRVVILPNDTK